MYDENDAVIDVSSDGTSTGSITIQNYPGEVAIIKGRIKLSGDYITLTSPDYGLVITSDNLIRVTEEIGSNPSDLHTDSGISIIGTGCDVQSVIIHNITAVGIDWFGGNAGNVSGCYIYNIGWIGLNDRRHGPGVYTHNNTGASKSLSNIIILNSARYAGQFYSASTNHIWNYTIADWFTNVGFVMYCWGAPTPSVDDITIDTMFVRGSPRFGELNPENGNYNGSIAISNLAADNLTVWYFNTADVQAHYNASLSILPQPNDYTLDTTFTTSATLTKFVPNANATNFGTTAWYDYSESGSVTIDLDGWHTGSVRLHNPMLLRTGSDEYVDVSIVGGSITIDTTIWTVPAPQGWPDSSYDANAISALFGALLVEKI